MEQNNWTGGEGFLGPVNAWGTKYAVNESISTGLVNKVFLIPIEWDYCNWIKHVVDSVSFEDSISGINWGFQPADIDCDGDLDLIGYPERPKWYEAVGQYDYIPHDIDTGTCLGLAIVCPVDLDRDGDIDVLRGMTNPGSLLSDVELVWFENELPLWYKHIIFHGSANWISFALGNIDDDLDIDIILLKTVIPQNSTILLFRNIGEGRFIEETITSSYHKYWRCHLADVDNDKDLDICIAYESFEVLFNNGFGEFDYVINDFEGIHVDGFYPGDVDRDGDVDFIVGLFGFGMYFASKGFGIFKNNEMGRAFETEMLWCSDSQHYEDGTFAIDIDLDGFLDILGSHTQIGWFRQTSNNPLNFENISIDNYPSSLRYSASHWVYGADLDNNCFPDIDVLTIFGREHIVYENAIFLSFASHGVLESSILDVETSAIWYRIGWEACIPSDSSIAFYWRVGFEIDEFALIPWIGPYWGFQSDEADDVSIIGEGCFFQYKVEFFNNGSDIESIAVLHRFWVEYSADESICFVHPKPFSPNGDGINDYCQFEYLGMSMEKGVAVIYNLNNILVTEVRNGDVLYSAKGSITWDGRDRRGEVVNNGVYVYVIEADGRIICNGTVYVAK